MFDMFSMLFCLFGTGVVFLTGSGTPSTSESVFHVHKLLMAVSEPLCDSFSKTVNNTEGETELTAYSS